ncbi:hypothetical protein RvY_09124 [Ramazzottius varieornatus]|uniref:Rap-GAP domain-containing protein n=1 Tax=Ramazzottius varieornatus TaxID=947166 RepID=A0A1D1V877_RAMVA|nr:hypothetical protein RvY_09124 [Ramazzottius varieornatus]
MFSKKHSDLQKSLVKLSDNKKDIKTRFKHLKVILDNGNAVESKKILSEDTEEVFRLFTENFSALDQSLKLKGQRVGKEEIDNTLHSLEKLLLLLPEYVRNNAEQLAIIVTILKRCLHPGSTLRLRHDAMRPFLIYYQIMRDSCPEDLHLMFGLLVPGLLREPFGDPQRISSIFHGTPPLLHPPPGEKPPDQITRLMFETLLDYLVSQVFRIRWDLPEEYQASFLFIFERFKNVYLPHVFPRVRTSAVASRVEMATPVTAPVPTEPTTLSLQVATTKWLVTFLQCPDSLRGDSSNDSQYSREHEGSPDHSDQQSSNAGKISRESSSSGFASAVQSLWHSDQSFHSNAQKAHNVWYPLSVYSLVRSILLSNPQNTALIHGIFETALQFPVRETFVIRRVISVYHSWISLDMKDDNARQSSSVGGADATDSGSRTSGERSHIFGSQNALKVFCTNSVYTFISHDGGIDSLSSPTRSQTLDDQEDLCKRVIALYRHAITKVPMSLSSWECILSTLLRVLTVLMPLNPPKDRLSLLCGRLAVPVFQTVLVAWVKGTMSAVISVKLWDDLTDLLSTLTAWDELIIRWEKTLELITKMLATEVFGIPSEIENSEDSRRVLEASPVTNEREKDGTLTAAVNFLRPRSNASNDIEHLAAYNPRNSYGPSETSGMDDTSLSDIPEPEELDEDRGSTLKAGENRQRNFSGENEQRSEDRCTQFAKFLDSSLSSSTPDSLKDRDSLNSPLFYPLVEIDRQRAPSASSWISVMAGGQMQGWSPDSTCALWFRVFGVIGPVNKIKQPISHKFALQSVNHIVHLLHAIHEKERHISSELSIPKTESFIPVSIVVPLLCEATDLPDTFHESQVLALQMLLEIAFRVSSLPKGFLGQLFHVVHKSLLSQDQGLIETTLNYGGMRLFLGGLPSAYLLLEDVLRSAEHLLGVENPPLQLTSIRIVTSVLSYLKTLPKHFEVFCPTGNALPDVQVVVREELEQKFYDVIFRYTEAEYPPLIRISAFYCIGRVLTRLLDKDEDFDLPIAEKFVSSLLSALRQRADEGASEATDVLFMLSIHAKDLLRLNRTIVMSVVETICAVVNQMAGDLQNGSELTRTSEELFVKLMFCMCEWMTCTPHVISASVSRPDDMSVRELIEQVLQRVALLSDPLIRLNNAELASKVEEVRSKGRRGFSDHLISDRRYSADVATTNNHKAGEEEQVLTRRTTSIFGRPPPDVPKEKEKPAALVPALVIKSQPVFEADSRFRTLKLAGTYVARHFTSLLNALPDAPAWVLPGSSVSEGDGMEANDLQSNENLQIFTTYDTVISVIALKTGMDEERPDQLSTVPGSTSIYPMIRIIVRDLAGKYCYDIQTLFGNDDVIDSLYETQTLVTGRPPPESPASYDERIRRRSDSLHYKSPETVQEPLDLDALSSAADPTLAIMKYVEKTSPDLGLLRNHPINEAGPPPAGVTEEQEAHAVALLQAQDDIMHSHVADMLRLEQLWATASQAKPYEAPQSPFSYCSRFLSQLGYSGQARRQHVHLLNRRGETFRDLKLLDKRPNRETHKIAVIYVGRAQEDKSSVMTNDTGSAEYEAFVSRLGWKIDVASHGGFRGGLPHNSKQFSEAIYYASATVEILFHVATLIPAISTEDHTAKMRHIGNDEVHIVWSDHSEPYDRSILKTKFADVIICIYPTVVPALYRVQILQKADIPPFGPLYDGAVVEESSLADLVRSTALYAGRACRHKLEGYQYFFQERADYMRSLIQSHSLESTTTYESFLTALMSPQLPKNSVPSVPPPDVGLVLRPSWRDSQRRHNERARQVLLQRRTQGPQNQETPAKALQPNFGARYSYPLQLGANPAATDV